MELGLGQHQTIKQIQTLSPQMYMSMEILCLSTVDLEERIETEVEDNVALELLDRSGEGDGDAPAAEGGDRDVSATESSEAGADSGATTADDDGFEQRFEQWAEYAREDQAEGRRASSYDGERDSKLEALSNTEDRPESLQDHLVEQVDLLEDLAAFGDDLSPEDVETVRSLCREVIYNIDDRGYLLYSLEEIAESLETPVRFALLETALRVVQSLDPPGVGGRNLEECLLLQLHRDCQSYPLEEQIVREHLEDLGHNRLPKIAKSTGVGIDVIKTAAETIASLNPRPGLLYGGRLPPVIRPDVVVEEVDGKYVVRVENEYSGRLRISAHYHRLFKEARKNPEVRKYLKKKIDSAEWLMAAVRQRQSTLHRIAEELVRIQVGFLDHGISKLKPLKMIEVAEVVGVHVSTISRAISDKYMQTPRGIYPMKFFFTGGASKSDGSTEARGSVIHRIKALIEAEDKKTPLSDIEIARLLSERFDVKISRRTVTKYRESEGIPSSRERREY